MSFINGVCVVQQKGELNELQRKSPEDLWKEDLAVFIEELDVSGTSATCSRVTHLSHCLRRDYCHFYLLVRDCFCWGEVG